MKLAIVVPVYKISPDSDEAFSLKQCLKVLFRHDIYLVCAEGLAIEEYEKIIQANKGEETTVSFMRFPAQYFSSIAGYNQLMLSKDFYKKFSAYQYMLIYQLDAFIFRDDLENWCSKGYDYVGAPWINWSWSEHYARFLTLPRKVFTKLGYKGYNLVGNGGFSLRKTTSFINNLVFLPVRQNHFNRMRTTFFHFM
ncbi:MAG: DUF5672 family protein [Chitinophagaceae bacterium]